MLKTITNIRKSFPWFQNNRGYVYADNGATSLKPQVVLDVMNNYYGYLGTNNHNTDSDFSYQTTKKIHEARNLLAKLINAKSHEVIFTSGATESLSLFAHGLEPFLKKDENIVSTLAEHSSDILPWMHIIKNKNQLRFAAYTTPDIIAKIDSKTKILAIANVTNLHGYTLDIKNLVRLARQKSKNIIIVLDATQGILHNKIDVQSLDIDFMACSGHKMCGPTGVGLAYIKHKWLDKIEPLRFGGGMNNQITLNSFTYAPAPDKFEGGTLNIAGILGWAAAIKFLNNIGWDNIHKQEVELTKYIKQQFATLPNVTITNPTTKLPIVAFIVKNIHSQDVANYLGRKNIIVRSGLSCAKLTPYMTKQQHVVRASFYFYNSKHDVDCLVKALKQFKTKDITYGL